jgi:hypothetical protein
MSHVTISHYIGIKAPYDEEFIDRLRELGNWKFDYSFQHWFGPASDCNTVSSLILEHFGTDGTLVDQVYVHILLRAGSLVETTAKSLLCDGWTIARSSNFRALKGSLVTLSRANIFTRKAASGDWRIGVKAPIDQDAEIAFGGIGKMRAARALEKFRQGQLGTEWMNAISSMWISDSGEENAK